MDGTSNYVELSFNSIPDGLKKPLLAMNPLQSFCEPPIWYLDIETGNLLSRIENLCKEPITTSIEHYETQFIQIFLCHPDWISPEILLFSCPGFPIISTEGDEWIIKFILVDIQENTITKYYNININETAFVGPISPDKKWILLGPSNGENYFLINLKTKEIKQKNFISTTEIRKLTPLYWLP